VESWHKVLKYSISKGELYKLSFTGCVKHIKVTARDYDAHACATEIAFRLKRHPIVIHYPWMEGLPYLVQILIINKLKIVEQKAKEYDNNDGRELLDEVTCICSFYRQYQLPCRYIWSNDKVFGRLQQEAFECYKCMWEGCGFKICYGDNREYIAKDINDDPFAPSLELGLCCRKLREYWPRP